MLVILALLIIGGYLYFRIDDETRRLAERALASHCGCLEAHVGSARFTTGKGVTMYDVKLTDPRQAGMPETVLHVDELLIEGRFDIASLLRSDPAIDRVVIRRPKILLARHADGTWNFAAIQPPKPNGSPSPQIEIHGASVVLRDQLGGHNQQFALQDLSATITPAKSGEAGVQDFLIKSQNFLAKQIELSGQINTNTGGFTSTIKVEQAALGHELLASLPLPLPEHLKPLPALRATLSLNATAQRNGFNQPITWNTNFQLTNGEIHLPQLGRPLTSVNLVGECDSQQLRLHQATALWGNASLQAVLHRNGWQKNSPLAARCRLTNFDVKNLPLELAPADAQNIWHRFNPEGIADVSVDVTFDGQKWSPKATIQCRDASFEDAEKFPYRLTGGSGRIDLFGGIDTMSPTPTEPKPPVVVDLTAFVEGTPVRIKANFAELIPTGPRQPNGKRPMPPGLIEISGVGIPITPALIAALPDANARKTIRSLRPTGKVDVFWKIERTSPLQTELTTSLDMRLAGCQVNYTRFPYPLSNVTGWIRQRNHNWTFSELESKNAQGNRLIHGSGSLLPAESGLRFSLQLNGDQVPLDDQLYAGLPSNARKAWDFLHPRGRLDFQTTITIEPGSSEPQIQLSMIPHDRTVTIEPPLSDNGYRYRLERLAGKFDWFNNQLTIRGARAEHGPTHITTDGTWNLFSDGSWQLELVRLHADRLIFNHDLLLSSPQGLRSVLESLQPQGGFDLANSKLRVIQPASGVAAPRAEWDMSLTCHQASLQTGVPLEGISGLVRLIGSSDGVTAHTGGEIDLDSLVWNDIQLTQVRGPIWADGNRALIGKGAARELGAKPRNIEAMAYGGKLQLNSQVIQGSRPRYGLEVQIAELDVARLAAEWMQRPEAIEGLLAGRLEFQGTGTSIYGLSGRGDLVITDANLYELPVLVRLLKVLRNRTPDTTAFDRCEAKFTMRGEQIEFQDLDLLGDAVSLYGQGQASLDKKLNLTFHSLVGRTGVGLPAFRSLMGQASEQLLQLRVVGTVDAPEIRREVLPGVGNMIGQIQSNNYGPSPGTQPTQPRSSYLGRLQNQNTPTVPR